MSHILFVYLHTEPLTLGGITLIRDQGRLVHSLDDPLMVGIFVIPQLLVI